MANEQISEITTVPTNATVIKIINALIKRYNSLGSIYTFKGSVQTYDDLLAIQNPNVGDVYNVVQEDEEHQIAAGSNFVWDGTVWDNLGGSLAGLVQSVNGINPDSLGNVLLPLIKNVSVSGGNIVFEKNDATVVNVNNVKKLYISALGQNVDLNTLTEAGMYICGNNGYAANYENCPVQKAFLFEVQISNDNNMIWQFLTQYNDGSTEAGNQYVRAYQVSNGWSAWRMAGSGSNLTFYISLEQLGITPGEETFAAIHNALPLNSVVMYWFNHNTLSNYNLDFYPTNYGMFKATKQSNGITNFEYIEYQYVNNTTNIGSYYSTYYNTTYTEGVCKWNRHYSVEVDGTLAKQSDIPVIASETEAEAGTNNTKFMTPLRVKQAISALAGTVKSVNGVQPDKNGDVDITKIFPLWHNDYGNGNDGEFVPAKNITISGIKNYTRVNIPIGVTVTVDKFTHIKCKGNVEINGTLKAIGGAGGAISSAGKSGYFATGGTGGTANVYRPGAGGGALEAAKGVTGVTAVLEYLKTENTALTNIYSAGGGGGDWEEQHRGNPGVGGDGGGGVLIVCKNFAVSGNIDASGENGENGHSPYGTGGGGGGGGLVFVVCDDSNVTGTISVKGGNGGARAWSGWENGTGRKGANGASFIKER